IMSTCLPRSAPKGFVSPAVLLLSIVLAAGFTTVRAATNKKPILLSQATSTRAVAFESVTMKAQPFPLIANIPFSPDARTRICIFAMDLELLSGEGSNAFTSDAQDASGKIYPLRVEFMGQMPTSPGITLFVLRLSVEIG